MATPASLLVLDAYTYFQPSPRDQRWLSLAGLPSLKPSRKINLMEFLLIALLYGGGLLVATICMIFANRGADSIVRIVIYTALAVGCLFAQRSCWHVASDIGQATAGGSSGNITRIPEIGIGICIIWTVILVFGYCPGRKSESNHPPK